MTEVADARTRKAERPGAVIACSMLLCSVWGVAAVLTFVLLARYAERVTALQSLGLSARQQKLNGAELLCLLLVGAALLAYAIPRLLRGEHKARLLLWIGVPLLLAEPVRETASSIVGSSPDWPVISTAIAVAVAALLAVALLALPSVTTYVRMRSAR